MHTHLFKMGTNVVNVANSVTKPNSVTGSIHCKLKPNYNPKIVEEIGNILRYINLASALCGTVNSFEI